MVTGSDLQYRLIPKPLPYPHLTPKTIQSKGSFPRFYGILPSERKLIPTFPGTQFPALPMTTGLILVVRMAWRRLGRWLTAGFHGQ